MDFDPLSTIGWLLNILRNSKEISFSRRIKYSFEEDQAILNYLRKFEGQDIKLSGNKIWQEMEDKKVSKL